MIIVYGCFSNVVHPGKVGVVRHDVRELEDKVYLLHQVPVTLQLGFENRDIIDVGICSIELYLDAFHRKIRVRLVNIFKKSYLWVPVQVYILRAPSQ
jgi:hypothetical protein